MCNYVDVTVDLMNYQKGRVDLRIPLLFTVNQLIEEVCQIYNLQAIQEKIGLDSIYALVSLQFISNIQTLAECNIVNGEILLFI